MLRNLSDLQLLELLSNGETSALEGLMRRYEPAVYHFSLKILRSEVLAQEVSQDIFLKIWENRAAAMEIGSVKGWLYTLARNLSLNTLKENSRRRIHETLYSEGLDQDIDGEADILFRDLKQLAAQLINRLSPQRQRIYRMKAEQGMSTAEIAAELNLSESTVRNQLSKSYQILKSLLADHAGILLLLALLKP